MNYQVDSATVTDPSVSQHKYYSFCLLVFQLTTNTMPKRYFRQRITERFLENSFNQPPMSHNRRPRSRPVVRPLRRARLPRKLGGTSARQTSVKAVYALTLSFIVIRKPVRQQHELPLTPLTVSRRVSCSTRRTTEHARCSR